MSDTAKISSHATAFELAQAASGEARDQGGMRAAISNALVGLKKEFYGKGPTAAKTYFNDDWVFTVLEGGLNRNEETLLEAGEYRLVRQVRLRFQEAVAPTICGAVEEITERKVLTYHSQILFDPVRMVEMFLLAPVRDEQAE
ncbi:MAG TPA: Na-translocating system protein MpsC family protein [Baekduia sp.]|nr:Na-translocating system protein MpsC family protein [Baekduia sp.]